MFAAKSTSTMGSTMAFICHLRMITLPGMRRSRRMSQNKRKSVEKAKTISKTSQMNPLEGANGQSNAQQLVLNDNMKAILCTNFDLSESQVKQMIDTYNSKN
eukprot:1122824-Ditylum_brightwellii.AAC.1